MIIIKNFTLPRARGNVSTKMQDKTINTVNNYSVAMVMVPRVTTVAITIVVSAVVVLNQDITIVISHQLQACVYL